MLTNSVCPDFLSGFTPAAFSFPKVPTRQWSYLTHSWGLGFRHQGVSTHRWALHVVHLVAKSPPSPCSSALGLKVPGSHLSPRGGNCIGLVVKLLCTGRRDLRTRLYFRISASQRWNCKREASSNMYAAYHTRRITQPSTDSQHLRVLYSPNLHQLFNLTWSTHVTWWFVSLTYILGLERNGVVHLTAPRCAIFTKHTPVQLFILTWSMNVAWLYVLDLHFTLEWHWLKEIATQPVRTNINVLLRCHF